MAFVGERLGHWFIMSAEMAGSRPLIVTYPMNCPCFSVFSENLHYAFE